MKIEMKYAKNTARLALQLLAIVAISMAMASFSSCTKTSVGIFDEAAKSADLSLELAPPATFDRGSKALTTVQQNAINSAEILVFKDNKLEYHKPGVVSDIDGVKKQVLVTLPASQTEDDLYDIMVIGNPGSFAFNDYIDKTKAELKLAFNVSTSEKWDQSEFVMYGETKQMIIRSSTANLKIQMLRSLARIDVGVGAYDQAQDSWAGLTDFTLTEVRVVNSRDKGAAIPFATTTNEIGSIKVDAPTIPPTAIAQGTTAATAIKYSEEDVTRGSSIQSTIFIAEAPNTTNKVTLLVGGSYKGGATSYYRVDMCTIDAASGTATYFNILRNHLYRITISSILGAGYTDPQEALDSPPANLIITLTPIEEGEFGDITFDGNSYIMTPGKEVSIYAIADGVQRYDLFSVKAGFPSGASAVVTGPGISTPLTLPNGVSKMINVVLPSGTPTPAKYTITNGRLTANVLVNLKAPISVDPTTQANIPYTGGTYDVLIISNAAWGVSCTTSGVTYTPNSGAAGINILVKITIPENTGADRSIPVVFTVAGGSSGAAKATWTGSQAASQNTVSIAGTKWRTSNLTGSAGSASPSFAANPQDYGMFFKWGDKWVHDRISSTADGDWTTETSGASTSPSSSGTGGTGYDYGSLSGGRAPGDPCQALGAAYKTPTQAQWAALNNTGSKWGSYQGVNGRFFGPSAASCTNTSIAAGCIFLPAAGERGYNDGGLFSETTHGYYWSSSVNSSTTSYRYRFYSNSVYPDNYYPRGSGYSVRCIKD